MSEEHYLCVGVQAKAAAEATSAAEAKAAAEAAAASPAAALGSAVKPAIAPAATAKPITYSKWDALVDSDDDEPRSWQRPVLDVDVAQVNHSGASCSEGGGHASFQSSPGGQTGLIWKMSPTPSHPMALRHQYNGRQVELVLMGVTAS